MFVIKEVDHREEKGLICNQILRSLPSWFGIEEALVDYTNTTKEMPFYTVYLKDDPVGFVAIKVHNKHTAEVYVMGILEEHHRNGLGRLLIEKCEQYCAEKGMDFLTVKTLASLNPDENYAKTRRFYESIGFKPLEVFKTLWDESNPCLFLVKNTGSSASKVKQFVKQHGIETKVEARLLDLISEVGELSKEWLKGSDYGNEQLKPTKGWEDELGDVMFSLTCIANTTGVSLEKALESALKKYARRFSCKGHIGSDGVE